MARVAEVSSAEAEPEGDGAAVATLKVDEVSSMDLAVCSTLSFNCRTFGAEKFIFLELHGLLLASNTVHHSTEVGLLALEAGEVRHLK